MVSGVTGHWRKVTRCEKEGKPFHRTAASSARTRKIKKLTGKQSWFKNRSEGEKTNGDEGLEKMSVRRGPNQYCGGTRLAVVGEESSKLLTKKSQPTTVLFCEYSKGGLLQSKLKEVADRLASLVGWGGLR